MRTFGLEIETVGSHRRVVEEFRAVGLDVNDRSSSYQGWSPTAWTVKYDGSVGQRGQGVEVASPPLDFDDPTQRAQIDLAVKALQLAGCTTDPSAGIHVHVGADDLSYRQVAAVARFFYKFEDVIYRIASSGWERMRPQGIGNYCRPLLYESPSNDPYSYRPNVKAMLKVRDEDSFLRAWYGSVQTGRNAKHDHYNGTRYHGVNLHAWWEGDVSTVEFRCFNSSLNPQRIQAYVALSVAIVQDAREGFSRSTAKSFRLGDMLAGRVSEKAAFLRLQQVLTCDTKDSKRVMSKEDWKLLRKVCWEDSVPQPAR